MAAVAPATAASFITKRKKEGKAHSQHISTYMIGQDCVTQPTLQRELRIGVFCLSASTRGRKRGKNCTGGCISQIMVPSRDVKLKYPLRGWVHYQCVSGSSTFLLEILQLVYYMWKWNLIDSSLHDPRYFLFLSGVILY